MAKGEYSILLVDDEPPIRDVLSSVLTAEGYSVDTASNGVEGINAVQKKTYHVVLLDIKMPNIDGVEVLKFVKANFPTVEVVMLTAFSDVKRAVECMRLGAYDYLTKPAVTDDLLTTMARALERRKLMVDNIVLKNQLNRFQGSTEMVGSTTAFNEVLAVAAKVAPTDSTVLIQGASGTGKELIATFIYKNSERRNEPFVTVDCTSIPDTLIESELFGHEKGSFTDAHSTKQGIVEIAARGTLFLDEIGEISSTVQPKLLRFIQTGEFRRVGGTTILNSDVRILSATNRNLREEALSGRFREDLLYRLNVITIDLPPLHQRKEDIPLLVASFLATKVKSKAKKTVSPEAMKVLLEYDWPGNIRELENVIERAAILCHGDVIKPVDLSIPSAVFSNQTTANGDTKIGTALPMKEIERLHIEGVLRSMRGNKAQAAKILKMSLKTLYTKLHQYQIRLG